jgi:hypothetical protein
MTAEFFPQPVKLVNNLPREQSAHGADAEEGRRLEILDRREDPLALARRVEMITDL